MEYIPSRDEFKHALHPTELKDRWNEIESYVYVISKRTRLHEMEPNDPPVNIFKIGVSTLRGKIQRMMDMRTFLISFKVHRLYLYERFQLAGDKKRREDSATYAYKAEQQLHNAVEHHFKPEKVRVSFPGSIAGQESFSEWFIVEDEDEFLQFLDKTVYLDVGVPPMYGSAFTATTRRKIPLRPNARGVGFSRIDT